MLGEFFKSITAYVSAVRLIFKLKLWKYVFIPGLISGILAGIIITAALKLGGPISVFLMKWYPFEWGSAFVAGLSGWLGTFVLVIIGFILYKNLVILISGPFMSPLSQKIEEELTGRKFQSGMKIGETSRGLVRGLRLSMRNIVRELGLVLLMLPFTFIPAIGLIFTVLIFIIQSYYAGFGNADFFMERHFSYKESIKYIRNHRMMAIGNGIVFMGLLLTIVGFVFAPPLSTIAATITNIKVLEKGGHQMQLPT